MKKKITRGINYLFLFTFSFLLFSLAQQGVAILATSSGIYTTPPTNPIKSLTTSIHSLFTTDEVTQGVSTPAPRSSSKVRAAQSNAVITNFAETLPASWRYYAYGALQLQNDGVHSFCKVNGRTVSRCGLYTETRDIEGGLDLSGFHSLRLTLKNLTNNTATANPRLYMSWYEAAENNALLHGYPELPTTRNELGQLAGGEVKSFDIPFAQLSFPDGYMFSNSEDLLAGIAVQAIDQDMGIVSIEVVSDSNGQITRKSQQHSGGYLVLKKKTGSQHRIEDMNFDRPWGQPFRNLGYTIEPGDTIEVYGVVNSGFIFAVDGTATDPITLRGATPDAAFDGKGATTQHLALNGGLVYLDGDYWNIRDLELRNCGLSYNGLDNAAGIQSLTQHSVISNVFIHTCGHGYIGSPSDNDLTIENSEFSDNGYFGSGQHHNAYINGMNVIFRNNYSHNSHSQNFKNRGCNTRVEANLFKHAENMEVDYPGKAEHPNDCEHIFTGNVIIQDHYPDNRTQLITFFEDNYDLGKKPWKLYLTNNTFIGSPIVNPSFIRIGENKIAYLNNNITKGILDVQFQGGGPEERKNGRLGEGKKNFFPPTALNNNPALYSNLTETVFGTDPGIDENFFPNELGVSHNAGYNQAPQIPSLQYNWPNAVELRPSDGSPDLGAYERGTPCVENWSCSEWSRCVDGKQTRECTDANSCGTEILKPTTTQDCVVCVPEWECAEWGDCYEGERQRECHDLHECGVDDGKPELFEQCQVACSDGVIVIQNSVDVKSNVMQSRMYEKYPKFAYDSTDNFIGRSGKTVSGTAYASHYNLKFDALAGVLPQGTFLTSAEMELTFYRQYTPATLTVSPLLQDWEPAHASWSLAFGAPDARHNFAPSAFDEVKWSQAGGTITKTPAYSLAVEPNGSNRFTSRLDITEVAQTWMSGENNYGVQLRAASGEITDLFGSNYFRNNTEYLGPRLYLHYSTCAE